MNSTEPQTVAVFLCDNLAKRNLDWTVLLTPLGIESKTVAELFLDGRSRVPIRSVKAIAEAIGANPWDLLVVVLKDYLPETLAVLDEFTGGMFLSDRPIMTIDLNETSTVSRRWIAKNMLGTAQ